MRGIAVVVTGAAVAAVALVLLLSGLGGQDSGGVGSGVAVPEPGRAVPAATGAVGTLLRAGNVVLVARRLADLPATRRTARALGGKPTAALTASGQAVLARADPRRPARFTALAYERALVVARLTDPRLRLFVDHWLGRGAHR